MDIVDLNVNEMFKSSVEDSESLVEHFNQLHENDYKQAFEYQDRYGNFETDYFEKIMMAFKKWSHSVRLKKVCHYFIISSHQNN